MSDAPSFSTLTLPPDLEADDVVGLRDQVAARIAAVVAPKGKKGAQSDVALPEGLAQLAALPPHLEKPWKRFDAAVTDLETFRAARASGQANQAHAAESETEQDAANADDDDRWRAIERWLSGAAALGDDGDSPSPSEARWLYAQLFPAPDGLRFITRRPRVQWAATEQRMKTLATDRAQALIAGFGGARHYKQLLASHARFGKAFGFSAVVLDPVGGPTDGRPQWVSARDSLRTLVQKIEGYADPEIEGSEALATFLLAPFVELVTDLEKVRHARAKKAAPAPAKPVPEPA